MKLVFVTTASFIEYSYSLVKGLGEKLDIEIFMQSKTDTKELRDWCKILNADFIKRTDYKNPFEIIRDIRLMRRLKKIKSDVVLFNTMTLYQSLLVKFFLKNYLIIVHDVDYHPDSKDYYSLFTLKLIYKLHLKKICTASLSQAELFKQKFGFTPKVLPIPITEYFYDVTGDKHIDVKKVNNQTDKIRFLYFSTIEPYKGIERLLDAAKLMHDKNLSFELNIFGKINYDEKKITDKCREIPQINLLNKYIEYNNIHRLFCENDILILPYKQVTQCGPLMIAYKVNMPVIVSDLPGFREYVDNVKSGLIFNNTAEDLAHKMEMFIDKPEMIERMSLYIKDNIQKKYSIFNLSEKYISEFEELAR